MSCVSGEGALALVAVGTAAADVDAESVEVGEEVLAGETMCGALHARSLWRWTCYQVSLW